MLKNKIIVILTIIVSVTVFGCTLNKRSDVVSQSLLEIDISKSIDKVTNTNLSCISENIMYIPLQTLSNVLLKSIINIQICKSGIYICDGEKVLRFSSTGTFIKQIGVVGNGPGEYLRPSLLAVNEEANVILINCDYKGILKYDLNGNYIDVFKNFGWVDQNLGSITNLVNKSNVIYLHASSSLKEESNIIVADNQLNVLKRYQNIQAKAGAFSFSVKLYCFNNEVFCKGAFNDTIFKITKEGLKPHAIIRLGNNQLPTNLTINEILIQKPEIVDKYFIHANIIETEDFLLAELSTLKIIEKVKQNKYLFYNKIEKTQTILPGTGFVNDINNGVPFTPRWLQDSICIDYIDAYKLIEWVNSEAFKNSTPKYPEMKAHLEKVANSIKETDNPILILLKL